MILLNGQRTDQTNRSEYAELHLSSVICFLSSEQLTPETFYYALSRLIMDFAAAIPDLKVGSNPLSPAQPPAKNNPSMAE